MARRRSSKTPWLMLAGAAIVGYFVGPMIKDKIPFFNKKAE